MFSRVDRMTLGEQLAYLVRRFQPELERLSHVRGIPLSFGAEPFPIPIEGAKRLVLPDDIDLVASMWYAEEGGWLDWALQRFGLPLSSNLVSRTGGVTLSLGAYYPADS
jgi:hypothetical protein